MKLHTTVAPPPESTELGTAVLRLLSDNVSATAVALRSHIGCTLAQLQRHLDRLASAGRIIRAPSPVTGLVHYRRP